ncbi:DNA-binding protein [Nonomuraea spiralis]|uniref:DNA-binding protein n=1 Tax=Nonomuraea spiralis TaxID=46182 RepID=A0ABV5IMG7_9ACTN|nr:DNA-binding protein [Nonomuraea spiralis]GGT00708.1 DNA-binding protein [Nonomuraea spiralis]
MTGRTSDTTASEAEEMLDAGAVLPAGAEGAGERAVPLVARAYRHPGLDDRVIVRLVTEELSTAEDAAAGFLGMVPEGEAAVVGLGLRRSLGFPEWVLVHHPLDGHHALAVVPELERVARQARSKPKMALDAYQRLAGQLAASVPHFLPTFYEQAARVFAAADNTQYAGQLFSAARRAEAQHGLAVDEDRLDAVFLEFALAGALPVKALSGYAKELTARLPAAEALLRYARLCVRRTAGGLAPAAQMAADIRRLAKAAGVDAETAEQDYLAEVLALPAVMQAPTGWWKSHAPAVAALARQRPELRGTLLDVIPDSHDRELPGIWLDILESAGATAGLHTDVPERERAADGAAGWLRRFLAARQRAWGVAPHLPALHALIERMADRLRAELTAGGGTISVEDDPGLIDLLLALGVPVADPGDGARLRLAHWAEREDRRDLLALAADGRFHTAFRHGADYLDADDEGRATVRALAASPGGRPMLTEWVRLVARRSAAAGLPTLPDALRRLAWLPGEALALAEDEVRQAVTDADVAGVLARALRAGIIDELGWPAFEEAAAELVPEKDVDDLVVCDAWPHLVVAGTAQARVLTADGVVLTHDLRIPREDTWSDPGFHYVDGELLVYWDSRDRVNGLRGYWHTAADRVRDLDGTDRSRGTRLDYYTGEDPVSLPVPGGGRTTGYGVLHAGDTAVPDERPVLTDGTSFWTWVWAERDSGWYEFDPAGGQLGRKSLPGFLAGASQDRPAEGWLLPAPSADPTPVGTPVDGLYGLRVTELPDGSHRAEDLSGIAVTLPPEAGVPARVLTFPGAERPCAVVRSSYRISLVDADGVLAEFRTDARPGAFGAGTLILPPERYWNCLRPRDPEGSAALRRMDRETAASLLEAAEPQGADLPAAIRVLLPGVTHESLLKGLAGVVGFAAAQQAAVRTVVGNLTRALAGGPAEEQGPSGPTDLLLDEALNGVGGGHGYHRHSRDAVVQQIRAAGRALAAAPDRPEVPNHLRLPGLPATGLRWERLLDHLAAVAYRTAAPTTPAAHRDALRTLLDELRDGGLPTSAGSARWRGMTLKLGREHMVVTDGTPSGGSLSGVLPLGGGAFVLFLDAREAGLDELEWTALCHDPAGTFEVPAPYTVADSSPVGGDREAGWLEAFLTELAERGPAPWHDAAAEEFARLTGVSQTAARLIVAGFPHVDTYERTFLDKEARTTIGVKVAEAAVAKDELRALDEGVRRAVTAALLPADPALLWSGGPDVAAAARVWNDRVGQRLALPEWLLGEAARTLRTGRDAAYALRGVLGADHPELSVDLEWEVRGDRVHSVGQGTGFTGQSLVMAVTAAGWLAHRLPAGHPLRAGLPATLSAVRDRLANPALLIDLDRYVGLPAFRKVAGTPTEVRDGYERYGALIMATHDSQPSPAIRPDLLDPAGEDPYLRALIGLNGSFPAVIALRTVLDPRFAALLDDPGDPRQGDRDADGTWWPQDPTRSVPDLVVDAAKAYGLGEDAAAVYLMLLAMPDPADRNVSRWTGWKPARLKAARAELAATDLVVQAVRTRAGRSLFLPGGWSEQVTPRLPLEQWKLPMFVRDVGLGGPIVPAEPVADLYDRAWRRVQDGDVPRFARLDVKRGRRR